MGRWEAIKEVMQPGQNYTARQITDLIYDEESQEKSNGLVGRINDTLLTAEKYGLVKLVGLNFEGSRVWERVIE